MSGRNVKPITSVVLENAGARVLEGGVATFGQAFARGEWAAGAALVARGPGGVQVPLQTDVKTRYEDGSVKFAVLSAQRPDLAAGQRLELSLETGGVPPARVGASVDLAAVSLGHSLVVTLSPEPGAAGAAARIDVMAALRSALADGSASFWQRGELATQARVSVDLPGSQRLLFDVMGFADGQLRITSHFNNDDTMGVVGGRVRYTAVAELNGREVMRETVNQAQYQNWRETFTTDESNGGQGSGDPSRGWLNIRHDLSHLSSTGAVARYDTSITLSEAMISRWETARRTSPDWGDPLASNNIRRDMGAGGGREELGMLTAGNTAWLMSGDPRVARYALDQSEVVGAVPWNHWDAANRTWLNTDNYPLLWTDGRGGTGVAGNANSRGMTQQVASDTGWGASRAHQPELAFVPYLLTGDRMHMDAVHAQATFMIMNKWPAPRQSGEAVLVASGDQLRGQAWAMRQVENAAWAAPDGSAERAYFRGVADANWARLVSRIPEWKAAQGEAFGWVPGQDGRDGGITQFGQDYFASTAIMAASRGSVHARTFLTDFMANYLIGRFESNRGWNPRDGVAYLVSVGPSAAEGGFSSISGTVTNAYRTWAEMAEATRARGWSNGTDSWAASNGEYGRLGMASLAGLFHLTGDRRALEAYIRIAAEAPPFTDEATLRREPVYGVTIEGIYGGTVLGGAGNDTFSPGAGTQDLRADLGAGVDTLHLGARGNTGWVRNTENLFGSQGNDVITLHAVMGSDTLVDLRGGRDILTLASPAPGMGPNRVQVAGVEVLMGSEGNDEVTLSAAAPTGMTLDGGAGHDTLTLAGFNNAISISGFESVIGGTGNDSITIGRIDSDVIINLGDGRDTVLFNHSVGNRVVTMTGVESVTGDGNIQRIIFGDSLRDAFVDLAWGEDVVILEGVGNSVTISNTETLIGGTGDDRITVNTANTTFVNGGTGRDSVFYTAGGTHRVSNVEYVTGGAGVDILVVESAGSPQFTNGPMHINLGGGADRVDLDAALWATLVGVEEIRVRWGAVSGNDIITLGGPSHGGRFDLGAGHDAMHLAAGGNAVFVANVEMLHGGSGDDHVTMSSANSMEFDGGDGRDTLVFAHGNSVIRLRGVEEIFGSGGGEEAILLNPVRGFRANMGGSNDTLRLADGGNSIIAQSVESIVGGTGDDEVFLVPLGGWFSWKNFTGGLGYDSLRLDGETASLRVWVTGVELVSSGSGNDEVFALGNERGGRLHFAGGAGIDRLTIQSTEAGIYEIHGVEFVTGAAGDDTIVLRSAVTSSTPVNIDLGGGANTVDMSATSAGNILTLRNTTNVIGSAFGDDVTMAMNVNGGSFNMGGGADTLRLLSGGTASVSLVGVESLFASNGMDTLTLVGAVSNMTVNMGGGMDTLILSNTQNIVNVIGTEMVRGGFGTDRISVLDATNSILDGGAGNDFLTGGAGNDTLTGGAGHDFLIGGAGHDVLIGGAGRNILMGSAGHDTFVFTPFDLTARASDTVMDFRPIDDTLRFEGFRPQGQGGFAWRGSGPLQTDGRTQARFDDALSTLHLDRDGNGTADWSVVLHGVRAVEMSVHDFTWA